MNKTAFITGATSGIGKATAEIFAKKNIRLILCGRRVERLKESSTTCECQITEDHNTQNDNNNNKLPI